MMFLKTRPNAYIFQLLEVPLLSFLFTPANSLPHLRLRDSRGSRQLHSVWLHGGQLRSLSTPLPCRWTTNSPSSRPRSTPTSPSTWCSSSSSSIGISLPLFSSFPRWTHASISSTPFNSAMWVDRIRSAMNPICIWALCPCSFSTSSTTSFSVFTVGQRGRVECRSQWREFFDRARYRRAVLESALRTAFHLSSIQRSAHVLIGEPCEVDCFGSSTSFSSSTNTSTCCLYCRLRGLIASTFCKTLRSRSIAMKSTWKRTGKAEGMNRSILANFEDISASRSTSYACKRMWLGWKRRRQRRNCSLCRRCRKTIITRNCCHWWFAILHGRFISVKGGRCFRMESRPMYWR